MASECFGNWQDAIDRITKSASSTGQLETFSECKTNLQRIDFVRKQDFLKDVKWLPTYFKNCHGMHRKSPEKASQFRAEGNNFFKKENYEKALEMYTESILHAPLPDQHKSILLAQALGNRSAAFFHLKKYQECLGDITKSLESGYPVESCHKLLVRKTYCLLHLGAIDEAEIALQELKAHVRGTTTRESEFKDGCKSDITQLEKNLKKRSNSPKTEERDKKSTIPQLEYGASDKITQASSAIVMKKDEVKGRYLITTKPLKAGDTLIVEEPFASVLLPDHYKSHCHHCVKKLSPAPVPCSECSMVRYCSATCRDQAWSIYHQVECNYQDLFFSVGIAHLSIRIVLTAGLTYLTEFLSKRREASPVDAVYGPGYAPVYDLLTHEEDMEAEDLFQYTLKEELSPFGADPHGKRTFANATFETASLIAQLTSIASNQISTFLSCMLAVIEQRLIQTASLLLQVLQMSGWIVDSNSDLSIGSVLLRHILQLVCNAHAITELQVTEVSDNHLVDTKSQVRVATAIYPTASLMNHSCDPTILSSFQGSMLVVRAVKDVTPGEEIFNCYGPHYRRMSREERQQVLSSQYFFTCLCTHCQQQTGIVECILCGQVMSTTDQTCPACQDKGHSDRMMKDLHKADESFKDGLEKLKQMNIQGAISSFRSCVEVRARTMYRHHQSLSEARDCLAKCLAMIGEFTQAADHLEENLPAVTARYGESSIEVGYELQKLAEILFNDMQVARALGVIERALDIFSLQFGEHSEDKNMKELREMRDCLLGLPSSHS